MGIEDSKSYQLRVRVTTEERDLLQKLCAERNRGETISDLVREGIALLVKPGTANAADFSPDTRMQVERLAELLKREPRQVEEACVQGILDLIKRKCDVPLIVMETHLHLKYRAKDDNIEFPWNADEEPAADTNEPANSTESGKSADLGFIP
jgi:hypothetical protein